jgi:FKBP-type peptidyl-prolyl cis-trans isomerase FkpA
MKKIIPILIIALFATFSCGKSEEVLSNAEQLEIDLPIIQRFLTENNLTAQSTSSGLHYIITEQVDGSDKPTLNHKITVHYKGYYIDTKEVFDQTEEGIPYTTLLARTIDGWREGIPFFTKGSKGMLIIPSRLAYGPYPEVGIKPNAILVFEIELLDFF